MPLKLVIESPEKIRLCDPDRNNNFKTFVLRPLVILLIFGSLFYFFGIFHPSYQIYCDEKGATFASNCRLKSTYYFIIPWYTQLGDIKHASVQINPIFRQGKRGKPCSEIALLTSGAETNRFIWF